MPQPGDGARRVDGDEIFRVLRSEILEGLHSPATAMRETVVAARFGVSRTPVREALTRLQHERLLERGARGLQVPRVDSQEVIQVYDLRVMLEEEVAGQAALGRSSADVIVLEALIERDRSLVNPDDQLRTKSNLTFHAAIWAATHNAVLQDLLERLSTHLIHSPHSTLSVSGRWFEALAEHAALVEAIADRRADDARSIARSHMETARTLRLKLIRDSALDGQD